MKLTLDDMEAKEWLRILEMYRDDLNEIWFGDKVVDLDNERKARINMIKERLEKKIRDKVLKEVARQVEGMSIHMKISEKNNMVLTACGQEEFDLDIRANNSDINRVNCGSCKRTKKYKDWLASELMRNRI